MRASPDAHRFNRDDGPREALPPLGPLLPLWKDASVREILVVRHDLVYVERQGRLEESEVRFAHPEHLFQFVIQLASAAGREISLAHPATDARLGGARITLTIPPLSRHPSITIRKHDGFLPSELHYDVTRFWSPTEKADLYGALSERRNILIAGAAATGKTTLLRHLLARLPDEERVVSVEETFELDVGEVHPNGVALETRPPNREGRFGVDMAQTVRHMLHMRPDRIVVGEVRGPEALPLLLALGSGHRGLIATIHADDGEGALRRIAFLAHLGAPTIPLDFLLREASSAIDLVVCLRREPTGERRVSCLWRR